jgi:type I restriction enzyme R subunit
LPANIRLEPGRRDQDADLDALGETSRRPRKGFIDFLLLDEKGFPFIVLEAKAEDKSPLVGKEQARKYAKSQNCRFVILSNGNLHYFWDLERGNPTSSPLPDAANRSRATRRHAQPESPDRPSRSQDDYIVLTQRPNYAAEAAWKNEAERPGFIQANGCASCGPTSSRPSTRCRRPSRQGKDRFLFEMATGTGKTLTAAAVIKLFLRTGNARRVLFLVDRLELEDQANKAFVKVLPTTTRR